MIVVTGRMVCHPESVAEFTDLVREVVSHTRDEPDCLEYRCSQDVSDPNTFVFVEYWPTRDALRAHVETEHYRRFKRRSEELVSSLTADIHTVEKTLTV